VLHQNVAAVVLALRMIIIIRVPKSTFQARHLPKKVTIKLLSKQHITNFLCTFIGRVTPFDCGF